MMKKTTLNRCTTRGFRILELPLHLIFDILSRLPIETIFSCKCVCKTFLDTLTNPYFVQLHLTRAPSTEDGLIIQDRRNISNFLLVYDNRRELGKTNSDQNCDYRPCQTMTMPAKASQFHNHSVFINGSCNGLLCLSYCSSFPNPSLIHYICNPILGEFLPLPDHPQHDYPQRSILEHGFGFCPKTKLFKVLRFITPSICSIFTLGTDSWREIGELPSPRTNNSFDCSFSGNLHWITKTTKMSNLICSFNLETEQFSYISPPVHLNKGVVDGMFYLTIGLLDGLFCLSYTVGENFEAFVMKDYAAEGCWTKKFSVDLDSSFYLKGLCKWLYVIGLLNNGELVLLCDKYTLFCFDIQRDTTRYIHGDKNEGYFNVLSFIPSFISLKDMSGPALQNVEVVQRKTRHNLLTEKGFKFIC